MKNIYENPEMEIVMFAAEDVISTSALPGPSIDDMDNLGGLM